MKKNYFFLGTLLLALALLCNVNSASAKQTTKNFSGSHPVLVLNDLDEDPPVVGEPACVGHETVTDHEGNTYPTVQLGNQCWMAQNLRVKTWPDGTKIEDGYGSDDESATIDGPALFYTMNRKGKVTDDRVGQYYNFAAFMAGEKPSNDNPSGVRGICPEGWHIPSAAELTQLRDYLLTTDYKVNQGIGEDIFNSLTCSDGYNTKSQKPCGFNMIGTGYYNFKEKAQWEDNMSARLASCSNSTTEGKYWNCVIRADQSKWATWLDKRLDGTAVDGCTYANPAAIRCVLDFVEEACPAPKDGKVENLTPNSATLIWTPVGDEKLWTVGNEAAMMEMPAMEPKFNLTNLTPGTEYTYTVRAMCEDETFGMPMPGEKFLSITFTTPEVCPAPIDGKVIDLTPTSATLTWTPVGDEEFWGVSDGMRDFPASEPKYTLSKLTPGTTYTYQVRAVCDDGPGEKFLSITFTTPEVCPAPIDGKVIDLTPTSATLTWTPVGDEEFWGVSDGMRDFPASEPKYTLSKLTPSTTYTYQVRAVCDDGPGEKFLSITFTTPSACPAPVDGKATNITKNSAVLTWTPVGDEESWGVSDGMRDFPASEPTYKVSKLTPGTTYTYYVRATCFDEDGNMMPGEEVLPITFTTLESCPAPTDLKVKEVTYQSATITWMGTGSFTDAPVSEYRVKGTEEWTNNQGEIGGFSAEFSRTINGLDPKTTYEFRVRNVCSDMMGISDDEYSEWATIEFKTPAMPGEDTCAITEIPYLQDFEGPECGGPKQLPTCWTYAMSENVKRGDGPKTDGEAVGKSHNGLVDDNGEYIGGTHNLGFGWPQQAKTDITTIYVILPAIDKSIDMSKLEISGYFFNRGNYSEANAMMEIGILTDPKDTSTFTVIDTVPVMSFSGTDTMIYGSPELYNHGSDWWWHKCTFQLNKYQGTGRNIALRHSRGYKCDLCVDNISINYGENSDCPDPKKVLVSDIKSKSAKITWVADVNAKAWNFEYKEGDGEWNSKKLEDPEFFMEGLTPDTKYTVRVKAACADDVESRWVVKNFTTLVSCPAPVDLKINASSNSAELTWTSVGEETSWRVMYCPKGSSTDLVVDTVNVTTYTMKNLKSEQGYEVYVKALCSETESSQDIATTFMTEASCPIPNNITINDITAKSVVVSWEPGGDEKEWEVTIYNEKFGFKVSEKVQEPKFKYEGLDQGTEYFVYVKAICSETDMSKDSKHIIFNTLVSCPSPKDILLADITDSSAVFTWEPGGDEKEWELSYYYQDSPRTTVIVKEEPKYTMTGLNENTIYYVDIRSICGEGDTSARTGTKCTTKEYACLVPKDLEFTDITTEGATATWKAGSREEIWFIQFKVASVEEWGKGITLKEPTYVFTGLAEETEYQVRIMAMCSDNRKSDVLEGNFKTIAAVKDTCAVPADVKVDSITKNSAIVTWAQAEGTANEWEVRYRQEGATEWANTLTVSETTATLTDLTPETAYEVDVTAHCVNGVISDPSAPVKFKTIPDAVEDYVLNSSISLFPNPTTGVITCSVKDLNVERVEVYDVYGKLLNAFSTNESVIRIDASNFANGMYFVRIYTEQGNAHKAFIKK